MDLSSKVKIHNKFDIVVRDAKTGEQKECYEAYNIVKNYCYDRILNDPTSLWNYIAYGSGTGTPSPTNNTLFNFLGSVPATRDRLTYGMPTTVAVYTGRIASNQAVGQLITEIGLAASSSSSSILTHALIKDSAGNPIAIQKTDQDIVDIYATVYFNLEDLSATYGNNVRWVDPKYNAIIQRLLGNDYSHISYLYEEVTDHKDIFYLAKNLGSTYNTSVDIPNRKILLPTTRFNESTANGAIKGMTVLGAVNIKFPVQNIWSGFQFDNIEVATGDGSKTEFSLPWDNIRPGTLRVFVNGTPVTPVEVSENKLRAPVIIADGLGGLFKISGMSWQPNGSYVAIGTEDGKLRICKIGSTGRITITDSIQYTGKYVIGVDFTSNFRALVVVTSDGTFTVYDFDPATGTIGSQSYTAGTGMSQLVSSAMTNLSNLRVVPGNKVVILYSNNDFVSGKRFATVSLDTTLKRYGDLVQFANVPFDKNCDISADGRVLFVPNTPSIINFDPETGTVGASKILNHIVAYDTGAIHPLKLGVAIARYNSYNAETNIRFGALDASLNPSGTSFSSTNRNVAGIDYTDIVAARFSPDGALLAAAKEELAIMIHEVDFTARTANWIGTQTSLAGVLSFDSQSYLERIIWVTNDIVVAYMQNTYSSNAGIYSYKIIRGPKYHFKLQTPPAPGARVTASFAVDYIPKTSNYVLDISASIQFM